MTLISSIKNDAINNEINLSTLLRKVMVLAHELNANDISTWVDRELNGYGAGVELPKYRIHRVESKGQFLGALGRQVNNAPIPLLNLPKEMQIPFSKHEFREPISAIEDLLKHKDSGNGLQAPWPANIVALIADKIYEDLTCVSAWMVISRGTIVGIADSVRNKVLQMVLDIQKTIPGIEKSLETQTVPASGSPASNIVFNTHIYGSVGNIGQGSSVNNNGNVTMGNWDDLKEKLKGIQVSDGDLSELKNALDESNQQEKPSWTSRLGNWVGGMIVKAGESAINIPMETAGLYLSTLLKSYLGIN